MNNRVSLAVLSMVSVVVIAVIVVVAWAIPGSHIEAAFTQKNLDPQASLPLGTDWLGRDMFARTMKGLSLSIAVGAVAGVLSVIVAVIMAGLTSFGVRVIDGAVDWIINAFLGLPAIVLMLILSFVFGGGFWGIVAALALSTWPQLARLLQAETLKIRSEGYVQASRLRGKSRAWVAWHHVLPALTPHILTGLIVGFPHAILHESSLSFLGFGFDPATPSLGIILSDASKFITSGQWWLIAAPIVALVGIAVLLHTTGDYLRRVVTPTTRQD